MEKVHRISVKSETERKRGQPDAGNGSLAENGEVGYVLFR